MGLPQAADHTAVATTTRASNHRMQQRPRKQRPRTPPAAAPHANGRITAASGVQNAAQPEPQPQPRAGGRTGDDGDIRGKE
ncbi:hypothetical protein GW17_00055431, partial [Ensete ventricosum]